MPRLNRTGQVAELRRDWFDEARTVYQDCSTGVCKIVLSDGTLVKDHAANMVVGGGGQWAAWLDRNEGVFDSLGRMFPLSGLGPMGSDGQYALKVLFDSFGPWDVIEPNGDRWPLSAGDAGDIQLFAGRRGLWTEGGWIRTTPGLPMTVPNEKVWWPRAVDVGGRFFLLYQRQADSSLVLDGRVIGPSGNYFYPDLGFVNGRFVVVWSPNQADTQTQRLELTPAELAQKPLVGVSPDPEPPPDPEPEPEPEPIPMPESLLPLVREVFERRLGHLNRPATNDECAAVLNEVAWIKRADGWGLSLKPGGNNAAQPKTGIRVAYDILQNRTVPPPADLWDALGPSENPKPLWGQAHPHNDPARTWVPPVIPDGVTNPDPQPEPEPEPEPEPLPDPLAIRVVKLEGKVREQTDAILALVADLTDQADRLAVLENRPPQSIDVSRLRAKSNGGWLGHSHDIELKPE